MLENREIPLLSLLGCLRGRRDRAILRGSLRSPRRGEVQVAPKALVDPGANPWTIQDGPQGLIVASGGLEGDRMAAALGPWLEVYGSQSSLTTARPRQRKCIWTASVSRRPAGMSSSAISSNRLPHWAHRRPHRSGSVRVGCLGSYGSSWAPSSSAGSRTKPVSWSPCARRGTPLEL